MDAGWYAEDVAGLLQTIFVKKRQSDLATILIDRDVNSGQLVATYQVFGGGADDHQISLFVEPFHLFGARGNASVLEPNPIINSICVGIL